MTATPIHEAWQAVEQNIRFCCDIHRETLRAMYFGGAMAALATLTGWDPEAALPTIEIDSDLLSAMIAELTRSFREDDQEIAKVCH